LGGALPSGGDPVPDLADAVMARLDRLDRLALPRKERRPRYLMARRRRAAWLVPAAAAAVLLVASASIYARYEYLRAMGPGDGLVTVRFVLEAPEAQSVSVSGNFGEWSAAGVPLARSVDGVSWETTLRLRRSFAYQYNFIIDGQTWIHDPNAAVSIDDGFGGKVSLLDL